MKTPKTDNLWIKLMDACKKSGVAPAKANNIFSSLPEFRELERRESILVDAISEITATLNGKSNQTIPDIISGCVKELANVVRGKGSLKNLIKYIKQ